MGCTPVVEGTGVSEVSLGRVCSIIGDVEVTVSTCVVEKAIAAGVGMNWNDVNEGLVVTKATLDAESLARFVAEISEKELA